MAEGNSQPTDPSRWAGPTGQGVAPPPQPQQPMQQPPSPWWSSNAPHDPWRDPGSATVEHAI